MPGSAAELFQIVADAGANIDMIVQNVSEARPGRSNISFTLPADDAPVVLQRLQAAKEQLGCLDLIYQPNVGKLSLVGAGMRTNPGISAKFFKAISDAEVNVDIISTSEVRISVLVELDKLDQAVKAVHTAFGLDAKETEAVVYGGTGR